jgi:hypothetical protein
VVDFTVPAGAPRSFRVEHPEDGCDLLLDWTWMDAGGRVLRDQTTWFRTVRRAREVAYTYWFEPGAYRVVVTSHAGLRGEGSFVVPDPACGAGAVHVELR